MLKMFAHFLCNHLQQRFIYVYKARRAGGRLSPMVFSVIDVDDVMHIAMNVSILVEARSQ